jgi:hypothetical protein
MWAEAMIFLIPLALLTVLSAAAGDEPPAAPPVPASDASPPPAARPDAARLAGAYRWEPGGHVDILAWDELGPGAIVAFDDDGRVRALTPAGPGAFTAGRALGAPEPVGARVRFEPADGPGPARTLVWEEEGGAARVARRVEDARSEEVRFAGGGATLAGTLMVPPGAGRWPAIVLLHGSGPQNRNGTLPFARFLVRHGFAILAYDKRGVGGSGGDWREASFDVLADDALAAVAFLRARGDIDPKRIGLLGVSQGGWIGPLAASRSRSVAFLVSVSGPGVTPAEQSLDLMAAEMRLTGVPEDEVREGLALARLAYRYGRTGEGWEDYAAARSASRERSWLPYLGLPAEPADAGWEMQRLFYFHDPAPVLAAVRCPVLAVFGGKDSGVPAEKNLARWREGLPRRTLRKSRLVVLPGANHVMFEAATGSMFEIAELDRFDPGYRTLLLEWLALRAGAGRRTVRDAAGGA